MELHKSNHILSLIRVGTVNVFKVNYHVFTPATLTNLNFCKYLVICIKCNEQCNTQLDKRKEKFYIILN